VSTNYSKNKQAQICANSKRTTSWTTWQKVAWTPMTQLSLMKANFHSWSSQLCPRSQTTTTTRS